jgi:Arc/MetJ-type ribon-helix-helix transcriptional regulator
MPRKPTPSVRKIVSLPPELMEAIRAYRREGSFTSEAEAMRDLLRAGLEARAGKPRKPSGRRS